MACSNIYSNDASIDHQSSLARLASASSRKAPCCNVKVS